MAKYIQFTVPMGHFRLREYNSSDGPYHDDQNQLTIELPEGPYPYTEVIAKLQEDFQQINLRNEHVKVAVAETTVTAKYLMDLFRAFQAVEAEHAQPMGEPVQEHDRIHEANESEHIARTRATSKASVAGMGEVMHTLLYPDHEPQPDHGANSPR